MIPERLLAGGSPSTRPAPSVDAGTRTVVAGLGFPEAPRWHEGSFFYSDMAVREIVELTPGGERVGSIATDFQPSGLGWMPDGSLLVVAMQERAVMRVADHAITLHAELGAYLHADANDMVCAPDGTAYVTNLGYDAATEEPRTTEIIRVRPDGSVDVQAGPLFRPNGVALTPDARTLFVAETRVHRITAFAVDDEGALGSPREVAVLPAGTWADGICLDAQGGIWVADPKGQACRRILLDGTITDVIDTAPMACVACVLGGSERRTLFLALSALGDFADRARDRPGRIDALEVAVPGAGRP